EGIHLLYLEINKIFSLSCQPICNSAIISPEYLYLCQRKNMCDFDTKFSEYKRNFRSNLKLLDQNKFDLFSTHDNKMYMITKFSN
ncbi:hypothetical protein EGU08_14225, partial [Acinetobacter baumannii]